MRVYDFNDRALTIRVKWWELSILTLTDGQQTSAVNYPRSILNLCQMHKHLVIFLCLPHTKFSISRKKDTSKLLSYGLFNTNAFHSKPMRHIQKKSYIIWQNIMVYLHLVWHSFSWLKKLCFFLILRIENAVNWKMKNIKLM